MSGVFDQFKALLFICLCQAVVHGLRRDGLEASGESGAARSDEGKMWPFTKEVDMNSDEMKKCRAHAVHVYQQYFTTRADADELAKSFCKKGGDGDCMIERFNKEKAAKGANQTSIRFAQELCQNGKDVCQDNAFVVFKQHWKTHADAPMLAKEFCKKGRGDCMYKRYQENTKTYSKEWSIQMARELCKKGEPEPCRVNAFYVYRQIPLTYPDAASLAKKFCKKGNRGDCLLREYKERENTWPKEKRLADAEKSCAEQSGK